MLKNRLIPYIVGGCIVVFPAVFYVGYRGYQRHIDFERSIADAKAFIGSVEGHHVHGSKEHTNHSVDSLKLSEHEHNHAPSLEQKASEWGNHSYTFNGGPGIVTNRRLSKEDVELEAWVQTGELTPYVEQELKRRAEFRRSGEGDIIQRVVTPDGKLHNVIVPENSQYEEGDAILESELDPPSLTYSTPETRDASLTIHGVDYPMPDEYYMIADPYERLEYINKFSWSIQHNVSMAEVEKKIADGELDVSLSESEKRMVDEREAMLKRSRLLDMAASTPPLSDTPPVKVTFLPHNGDRSPGWSRKNEAAFWESVLETVEIAEYGGDTADAGQSTPSVFSEPPEDKTVESSTVGKSTAVEGFPSLPARPVAERIKTQLRERLSSKRFSRAEALLDEYGPVEGLRRLREAAPEAARQFEKGRRPVPSRDVLDGGQSESGSKD